MFLFAVALKEPGHHWDIWIEFYWADDEDHAREQAENAHENASGVILCVALCPHVSVNA